MIQPKHVLTTYLVIAKFDQVSIRTILLIGL